MLCLSGRQAKWSESVLEIGQSNNHKAARNTVQGSPHYADFGLKKNVIKIWEALSQKKIF